MCGICGFIGFNDNDLMNDMLNALEHRGPDDYGIYKKGNVNLGHRRLSIIDIEGGHQPIFNENNKIVLVFNGEIYNFKELRNDLLNAGHTFKTNSDSEVIIHCYEEYHDDFIKKFDGMFGFALWDDKRKRLILARDRLGIKPLYYSFFSNCIIFSSELKGIIQYKKLNKTLNYPALLNTLMFRYTHNPDTLIDNVNKVKPAHYLVFENNSIREMSYWNCDLSSKLNDIEEIKIKVRDVFRKTVKSHLISDVPIGVMLSGGLDSGSIVAFASEFVSKLKTFSIGFEGQSDNEFEPAKLVAKKFDTNHTEILITPRDLSLLPEVIWHNDEPVGGPSSIAFYIMLKEARKQSKVILFGHGADEILAGYEQLKVQKLIIDKYLKNELINNILKIGSFTLKSIFYKDEVFGRLHRFLKTVNNDALNYFELISVIDTVELSKFFKASFKDTILNHQNSINNMINKYFVNSDNSLEKILLFDRDGWLTDDINHRLDRMTMSASVEARVPFLDHHFVELINSIDINYKLHGKIDKYCMREAMRGILPEEIAMRKKQRFNTPIDHFFGEKFFNLCTLLLNEKNELNERYFNTDYIKTIMSYNKKFSYKFILKRNKLTAQFYARQLWNYVILQLWYKMFIEGKNYKNLGYWN